MQSNEISESELDRAVKAEEAEGQHHTRLAEHGKTVLQALKAHGRIVKETTEGERELAQIRQTISTEAGKLGEIRAVITTETKRCDALKAEVTALERKIAEYNTWKAETLAKLERVPAP